MVVVDVQVGVMREAWEGQRVIKNVSRAVERARSEAVPVLWVQHSNQELPKGSVQWQLVPELVPAEGEVLIHKKYNSSFEQTSLDAELACLGATHIVLAGAASNWCVRATAYGALDRGYDLTLVKDAHTTESIQLDHGLVIEAETVIQELNIAIKWLEYPGLRNGTANANDIEFAVPGSIK
jgi:nicotinamidase-related amidase